MSVVTKRDALHQIIDELSDDKLIKLAEFVETLQSIHQHDDQVDTNAHPDYSQFPQLHQLREHLIQEYNASAVMVDKIRLSLKDDNFSWLKKISTELQTEFLIDLLLAVQRCQQSHNWSELIQVVERWEVVIEGQPPFKPVSFPEGILKGYDFSPEFIAEARKEMWAGFGKKAV